jgi:hypothetical protein
MSRLIKFDLDSTGQQTILVESDEIFPLKGEQQVSVGGTVAEKASQAFDAALAGVKPIADAVMRQLTNAAASANEISVEFGIKLTANAGVILAGTSAEGNCKVSLKWVPKR